MDDPMPTPHEEQDLRVFTILDEIRRDMSQLRTDVAVMAAAQPRITDIIEDHERRIRVLEALTSAFASLVERTAVVEQELNTERKRIDQLRSEQDSNSWLPRLAWGALAVVVAAITSAAIGSWLPNATP